MAGVSFGAHRLALLAAYQEVIGEGSPTDWALYTYEDESDDLKLAASGGGGLQELAGHFENQKVMYGFCSVKEPQAALPKYVLVNWVGEDVADARKCACASHVAKIAEFFQGVDVIVNASSVEDVDPGAIGQRLSNGLARISSPVLHRLRLREDENTEPVGTTYQKTDAAVEMKRLNREQFWEQAKKEEELRKEEERQKVLEERLRFEQERMEQERMEQEERERRYREREEQIEEHRRKQQTLEAEEARQRLQEQSIFGEQQHEEENGQELKKSESEVEEAAAIIARRPDNPREFFKQQERVASGSSDATSPFSQRTAGRLHCPFIKTPDSGPPSSSSSSSSPPRTPFPYVTCHRTPNLSSFFPCSQSDAHRKASAVGCSPCDSSPASTPVGEQIERALDEVTQQAPWKDSPGPSSEAPAPLTADELPGGPEWTAAQGGGLGPTEDLVFLEPREPLLFPVAVLPAEGESSGPAQPPGPSPESLIDLWQNDSTTPPAAWELATPAPSGPPAPLLVEVDVPPATPAAPAPPDDNLLNFDELPEPPATFCDAEQDEEPASLIAMEGPHQMTLSYQHALQEAAGGQQVPDPQLLTNGEMAQKEGVQASEGYFSQSQDEEFGQVETSAKTPPAVFYAKPPEIDITCWDADPVPEDEESFGGSV
ncbi:drebrin isoform X1 [Malaclemys terrapin pileata]|uniref:drebrin isoform X1 n=1 Tax=Malaclemys terrapin pileata TaxID=2991368 RepID=UPI0023A87F4D|nr:drebrin isoform X1 [Malaclemys terrapin pileata]